MKISQASPTLPTAVIVFADKTVVSGMGFGAFGENIGEVCFNTAMTGYQEILTDPSYAAQIVTFTFPHIGNVGVNAEDVENATNIAATAARGAIVHAAPTSPSNHRAQLDLGAWMRRRGIIGISGVDTRSLAIMIRESGMPHAAIAHNPNGKFDIDALAARARDWAGLNERDLARDYTTANNFSNREGSWNWRGGYETFDGDGPHVVVIDYGAKQNILRRLCAEGCRVTAVPAATSAGDILALNPSGVVLSNGPADPSATAEYGGPVIRELLDKKTPIFGVCLGHQLLALALGAKTIKMKQGHHGANHPVKDMETGKVEIVSMNHGFTVDQSSLPENVVETHVSLFDGTNCGIAVKDAPAFSVQHHPEASPGPEDSFYIFRRFVDRLVAA